MKNSTWYIEMKTGEHYPFYTNTLGDGNPVETIKEFHHADNIHYIMDISDSDAEHQFNTYEEDDSFVLIPKNRVSRIYSVDSGVPNIKPISFSSPFAK